MGLQAADIFSIFVAILYFFRIDRIQGTLNEGKGSVQSTSLLVLVLIEIY